VDGTVMLREEEVRHRKGKHKVPSDVPGAIKSILKIKRKEQTSVGKIPQN